MNPHIEGQLNELKALCAKYHVRRLELFGSGSKGERFDNTQSDFDFLVEFEDLPAGQYADAYFGLLEDLKILFNRPIDLVMTRAIKNPYFLQGIESSRVVLYAA